MTDDPQAPGNGLARTMTVLAIIDERRCRYCEAPLTDKRSQAIYCDDLCGRAYRDEHRHMSNAARDFWKGVSSVSRQTKWGARMIPCSTMVAVPSVRERG